MAVQKRRMTDIARLAGVSTAAVSYALNGRPGVSQQTRRRIIAIAEDAGWFPNVTGRALAQSQVFAIGMVVTRPPRRFGVHPFHLSFIAGLEAELSENGFSLLLHVAKDIEQETARYKRWFSEGRVDGVVLLDLRVDDPRLGPLQEMGMPFVVAGDPRYAHGAAAVWNDDAAAVDAAVARLVDLGHRRLARVAEKPEMAFSVIRDQAFTEACRSRALPTPVLISVDEPDQAATVTSQLLQVPDRPSAVLYDSDLGAVAGLRAARALGVRVPRALSLIAYDDSLLCEATEPTLSAISYDVHDFGTRAAQALLALIQESTAPPAQPAAVPALVARRSMARASPPNRAEGTRRPSATD